jgi:DNA-binding MarR family transcriptional regulator
MTQPPVTSNINDTQASNYFKPNNLISNYFLIKRHMASTAQSTAEKAALARSARSSTKSKANLPQASVETVLDQWRAARPELDLGPLGLFAALAHAYWLTAPEIENLMGTYNLTRGMFDVLTTLRRTGPPYTLAPKELARSLILSGAGVTNRLDRLETLKLVKRLPEPRDRRGLQIELTAKGIKLVDEILPQLIRFERRLATGLSKKKTADLMRLLDELSQSLLSSRG